jgi:hypothetical protein
MSKETVTTEKGRLKRLKLVVTSEKDMNRKFMQGVIYACGTFTKSHGRHRGIEEVLRACGIKTKIQACLTGAEHYDLDNIVEYLE